MSRRDRSTTGFSLLEVLLAMVSLAMISAICYAAFHLGIRAVERGEVAVVTAQRLRVASDVLIRQIKSIAPYCSRNADEDVYPFFFGTPTSMMFITAAGLHGGGAPVLVSYRVEEDPPRLLLRESPFFSPDSLGESELEFIEERSGVILDGFKSLRFEYLLNDGADVEWRTSWDGLVEEILPFAIRITAEGLPGLETDVWGQEIPVMTASYTEGGGECVDDDLPERPIPGLPAGAGAGTGGEDADGNDDGDTPEDAEDAAEDAADEAEE